MSAAPNYDPTTSFADDETNNVAGRSIVKTERLDDELAAVSSSINALNINLQSLQRDDNKLKDSIVEPYALAEQTKALVATAGNNPRGNWQPNTDYKFKELVQRNNVANICLQDHNSGTSFVQALWLPISGDGTSAANAAAAAASASAALTSETNAQSSEDASLSNANSAAISASSAANSATNASNSSTASSISANNASLSATAADASAQSAAASAASIAALVTNSGDPNHISNSDTNPVTPAWVNGRALIQQGTRVTTPGAAAYDFAVPAGAKKHTISFVGLSTNGSSIPMMQLCTSGGPETTGYSGAVDAAQNSLPLSSGFLLHRASSAANVYNGKLEFTRHESSSNTWLCTGQGALSNTAQTFDVSGSKNLSSDLISIRITTVNGTDLFDQINAVLFSEF